MSRYKLIVGLIGLLFIPACSFTDEPGICPYNVRLDYWYSGSGSQNELHIYVDNLRQYLFDNRGNLLATEQLKGDSVLTWNGELPPGNYTVVAWGNIGTGENASEITGETTTLKDMKLSAVRENVPPGYRSNTERLYFGTTDFTVEEGTVCRKKVYVSHAHAALNITVRWTYNPPPEGGIYKMRMRGINAEYGFVKEREIDASAGGIYTIPWMGTTQTWHEARAAMNYEGEVNGELVTYRFASSTHEMWSLWRDDEQMIKELDLKKFFDSLPTPLDENVEQDFDLIITVGKDKINVALASSTDWVEGGAIG